MKPGTVQIIIAALGLMGILGQEVRLYLAGEESEVRRSGDDYQMEVLVGAYQDCREGWRRCRTAVRGCSY